MPIFGRRIHEVRIGADKSPSDGTAKPEKAPAKDEAAKREGAKRRATKKRTGKKLFQAGLQSVTFTRKDIGYMPNFGEAQTFHFSDQRGEEVRFAMNEQGNVWRYNFRFKRWIITTKVEKEAIGEFLQEFK